ncbi:hypothetical protein [Tessaracoccus antarcticus]|uniref:Uncharacterized protein n=1 Tax=Tessaracoccus antarcticus TaxID=2479848 RepID=A0A3M0G9H8_9ACTN|nr:hypothetical protein [Tessaracoccus antarcticus]RMB61651.1 hypothetical protein EAX62_03190 [Tessaracoccus antarcticus]
MSKALNRITPWIAGAALVVTLSACTGENSQELAATPNTASVQPTDPSAPMEPETSPGVEETSQQFEGTTSEETITANQMEIVIPTGLRIPEDTLVTKAEPNSIMMADEDPTAVTEMVMASAAEAGYEVYGEIPGGSVLVGHGNAVMFTAFPQVQQITWGPEVMKDVLATN